MFELQSSMQISFCIIMLHLELYVSGLFHVFIEYMHLYGRGGHVLTAAICNMVKMWFLLLDYWADFGFHIHMQVHLRKLMITSVPIWYWYSFSYQLNTIREGRKWVGRLVCYIVGALYSYFNGKGVSWWW